VTQTPDLDQLLSTLEQLPPHVGVVRVKDLGMVGRS